MSHTAMRYESYTIHVATNFQSLTIFETVLLHMLDGPTRASDTKYPSESRYMLTTHKRSSSSRCCSLSFQHQRSHLQKPPASERKNAGIYPIKHTRISISALDISMGSLPQVRISRLKVVGERIVLCALQASCRTLRESRASESHLNTV